MDRIAFRITRARTRCRVKHSRLSNGLFVFRSRKFVCSRCNRCSCCSRQKRVDGPTKVCKQLMTPLTTSLTTSPFFLVTSTGRISLHAVIDHVIDDVMNHVENDVGNDVIDGVANDVLQVIVNDSPCREIVDVPSGIVNDVVDRVTTSCTTSLKKGGNGDIHNVLSETFREVACDCEHAVVGDDVNDVLKHVGNDVLGDAVNNVIFSLKIVWIGRKPKQRNTSINRRAPISKRASS